MQTGFAVANDFGNPGHIGGNARRAERHRFEQHRGQTIRVAIRAHDARRGEHGGVLHFRDHFRLRSWPYQAHALVQTKPGDQIAQRHLAFAGADDVATERDATLRQQCTGVDQHLKTFLLDEPTDRNDFRRATFRRGKGETIQVQPVVEPAHGARGRAEFTPQKRDVEFAHSDDRGGFRKFAAQIRGISGFVKDVLRVSGEGEGNPREARSETGDLRGRGRKVRVQQADAALADEPGEPGGLINLAHFRPACCRQVRPEFGECFRSAFERVPELRSFQPFGGEIGDRSADARDGVLEMRVVRRIERNDLHAVSGGFVREDFIHDERLRKTRIALHDVGDGRL